MAVSGDNPTPRAIRFGPFELNVRAAELRKHGTRVRLHEQPFRILLKLLEHPGEVVLREEIRQALWPHDTVVEFDHGINAAVQRLRDALSDSADKPRYVETVARRGYRFIGTVEPAGEASPAAESRAASRGWKTWALVATLVLLAVAAWLALRRSSAGEAALTVRPVTSFPGLALDPSFSPDGNQIAFSRNGEKQDNTDIYVKVVDSSAPLRLTTDPAADADPAWSPDGRQIAFLRASGPTSMALMLISPLGGSEKKLADLSQGANPARWWTAPAWTPDSKFLAVRDDTAIVLVSVESGEKRKLTSPPDGLTGDWHAAFSPDGSTLAFARIRNGPTQDIFLARASDGTQTRQLTHDNVFIDGLAWTPDGKELVFASDRARQEETLWRISASGGTPERLAAAGSATEPAIAPGGKRAAFVRDSIRKSFWRLDLGPEGLRRPPVRLVMSSRNDQYPVVSPDGSTSLSRRTDPEALRFGCATAGAETACS